MSAIYGSELRDSEITLSAPLGSCQSPCGQADHIFTPFPATQHTGIRGGGPEDYRHNADNAGLTGVSSAHIPAMFCPDRKCGGITLMEPMS